MATIRLIHIADIHLGYTGSANLVFGENEQYPGRCVREVDIELSVERLTRTIIDAQPPVHVVVVAGDLFHRSTPYPRAVRTAAKMVRTLRQHDIRVVIIDGNHETSSWRQVGSPTSFLRELGAHVANTDKYKVFRDDHWGGDDWRSGELLTSPLAIHAVPYRVILQGDFTGVVPIPGYINVLLTHGRVQGMEGPNSLGRVTEHIPTPVLRRSWDYIALGDWHIHRHQPVSDAPAYYAGSLEALNFGEAASYPERDNDPLNIRGAIDVRLTLGEAPIITTMRNDGARPVLRLESVNAADMDPDALMAVLRQRLDSKMPEHALTLLQIQECPPSVYEQLKHAEIDRLRKQVRRCDIRWGFQHTEVEQSSDLPSERSIDDQWRDFLAQRVPNDNERVWYLEQGSTRIQTAREQIQSQRAQSGDEYVEAVE